MAHAHPAAIAAALAEPFPREQVKFRAGATAGNRAMALAYVDVRAVQDRLDQVLGVTGWRDEYEVLAGGSVLCRLRLRLGAEWITKMDVGSPSEQPDEGDRRKAAFSDALKRAAVKFGIGRYLYRLPVQWVDFDPKKRRFTRAPTLPSGALPRPATKTVMGRASRPLPADGPELQQRLYNYDARLARQGLCASGALVKHVVDAGMRAGFSRDLASWAGKAIRLAVEQTKAFEAEARKGAGVPATKPTPAARDKARIDRLYPLLKAARYHWSQVCHYLKVPLGTKIGALTDAQFEDVCKRLVRLWPLLERRQVVSYKALSENGVLRRSRRWNAASPPAVTNSWPTPRSIPASPAACSPAWNASSTRSSSCSSGASKAATPAPMRPVCSPT
jgi:hypothetical protein